MYGKLFAQMYDGSLYGNWKALVTFQQMIVLCDSDGVIDMTPHALAARTGIPLDIITEGIAALEQPDPYSRTPDMEGRRIERLDDHRPWGWRLVNYAKYRSLISLEEKRARDRARIAARRQADRWRDGTESDAARQQTTTGDLLRQGATESDKPPNGSDTSQGGDESRLASQNVALVAHTEAYTEGEASTPQEPSVPSGAQVWLAYRTAFVARYGQPPVRNAKINALAKQLVKRLGTDAPQVAGHYVRHNDRVYVRAAHALELLVRDAEKLHLDWRRGVTADEAAPRARQDLDALVRELQGQERAHA